MVTSRQFKEKIRDYRRSIKHSWQLFKESRIGMVGLVIMTFFIVMALVSPYLGLRHPLDWLAPDEDILEMTSNFEGKLTTGEPSALNFKRKANPDSEAERYYVAGGLGSTAPRFNYGLFAYSADGAARWGGSPFSITNSKITSNVHVERVHDIVGTDWRVAFGCENGMLYVLNDVAADVAPTGNYILSAQLNGSVVGVASFIESAIFVASTENGWLYAFRMRDGLIPMTGYPIPVSNVSLTAPAVLKLDTKLFVGSRDGWLHGYNVMTGLPLQNWSAPYRVSEGYWSGSPVIQEATNTNPLYVYASTDDGIIHCVYGENGTAKEGWNHNLVVGQQTIRMNGYQLRNSGGIDGGNLTDVTLGVENTIFIGSDSGYFYAVDTTLLREFPFNTQVGTQRTAIEVAPSYTSQFGVGSGVTVVARNFNTTENDPSDDFSFIYHLKVNYSAMTDYLVDDVFNVSWRKTIEGVVTTQPTHDGFDARFNIVFAVASYQPDGTLEKGALYSYNAAGRVITPLPPTWLTKEGHEDPKFRPPPSGNKYWLGTDTQGHDILSQTILGSRIALLVGFLSAFFSISIGVIFGLVSGYYGKGIDAILMRFTDVILVLPGLPLLIILAAIMNPSIWNIIFVISIIGWGGVARVIRAEVLTLKERPFIDAARVTGASKSRIMFKHIAPNVLPLGLLYMTFAISGAILFEAALSFIGLGDPSTMSWGMMLNYVQHSNALTNWWWLLPPGICITLVCMAFFLLGRAFDEIVNPRLRRRR